jgi:DNA polymerase
MNAAQPHQTLTAEHYWSADQLQVMRGLDVPLWFRPSLLLPTTQPVQEVASPPEALVAASTPQTITLHTSQRQAAQTTQTIANKPCEWLVLASKPMTEQSLLLWGNMLASVGKNEQAVHVTDLPTGIALENDPFSDAAQAILAHVQTQVHAMQPKLLIAMGELAAQIMLGVDSDLASMQGELHELESLPLLVMQHPEQVLKTPQLKAQAWRDLNLN